jgi:hypothetical protein
VTLTLEAAIESITSKIDTDFVQDWHEDGIPEFDSLKFKGGVLEPYIIVQFSDIVQGVGRSFAGTRGDDYDFPVRFMAVAPTAKIARQLRVKLTDKFTGFQPSYCAEMMKRGGGGLFTVTSDSGAVVAYVAPVYFRTSLTLFEIP